MTPLTTRDPAIDLERSRVALRRALKHYLLQHIPDNYAYSSAALNMLTRMLLASIDANLDEHFDALELEEDE